MFQINYRDARPIYEQVKDGFKKMITQHLLAEDEKLPSVREIAGTLAINPNTIQRAYRELEQEGYVYTIVGKGSFVAACPVLEPEHREALLKRLDMIVEELMYFKMTPKEIAGHILNGKDTDREQIYRRYKGREEYDTGNTSCEKI